MAAALVIRAGADADIPAITAIYAHHVRNGLASFEEVPPDAAEMARRQAEVQAQGLPYLVATIAGQVVGYAYAAPYRARSAYRFTVEDSVYVAPDRIGLGIGRRLLAPVIEAAAAAGKRQMVAVIGDSANAASIGLHQALGFRMAGTLAAIGFKLDRWVDSVLMQRALGDGDRTKPAR